MKTLESAENYLETILMLSQSGEKVRAIDIAASLEYSRPSVSVAMKNLRSGGFVEIDRNGHITLTESGHAVAQSMLDRHTLLSEWLIHLGVSGETAVKDACKMEHAMSQESFLAISQHIEEWKRSQAGD